MAEPQPGYTANEGDPEQLPRGEATALNEGTNVEANPIQADLTAAPPAEAAPTEAAPAPTAEPDQAAIGDYDPTFTPENDDEAFLTAPTGRPDEPVTTGAFYGSRAPLPADASSWLPVFAQAAKLPDAPPQLKALVALLMEQA